MCKHILNQQVHIRTACCNMWFECPQCHYDYWSDPKNSTKPPHQQRGHSPMVLACKKCKKVFTVPIEDHELDMEEDGSDGFCPKCDNHWYVEAKEAKPRVEVEGEDVRKDARMLKDERMKQMKELWDMDVWDDEGEAARLG